MAERLDNKHWDTLLGRIAEGKCTPFLGAGAAYPRLPLARDIAEEWARAHGYPLDDCMNLARVSQFMAVDREDAMYPKDELAKRLEGLEPPDFSQRDEPHTVLAGLPLPIYVTTNYDDFMLQALKARKKDPKREICRWNSALKDEESIFESKSGFEPTPAQPVVYHLHGHRDLPESLVLTEDDYLDFLVNFARGDLVELRVKRALTGASLLFVGYSLTDWSFRVLFRGVMAALERSLQKVNFAVQLLPDARDSAEARSYLDSYFKEMNVRVYWGDAREFVGELLDRWEEHPGAV